MPWWLRAPRDRRFELMTISLEDSTCHQGELFCEDLPPAKAPAGAGRRSGDLRLLSPAVEVIQLAALRRRILSRTLKDGFYRKYSN